LRASADGYQLPLRPKLQFDASMRSSSSVISLCAVPDSSPAHAAADAANAQHAIATQRKMTGLFKRFTSCAPQPVRQVNAFPHRHEQRPTAATPTDTGKPHAT